MLKTYRRIERRGTASNDSSAFLTPVIICQSRSLLINYNATYASIIRIDLPLLLPWRTGFLNLSNTFFAAAFEIVSAISKVFLGGGHGMYEI